MIKLLPYAIVGALCLCLGVYIGYGVLCPSQTNAIVKQLKKDDKALNKAIIETKVKYVYRDKIKTVIKEIPADNCFDEPIPDNAATGLLDSFNTTRP